MLPPHRALAQRDFLAQFGAALTERVATASPPVYHGPTDAPWAPLRLLKRKPLGAQGLIAQAGACAIRGLRPVGRPGQSGATPGRKRRRGLGLVAEMATGKTLLSLAMLGLADEDVTRERAVDDQRPEKRSFFPAVVLCPPIVVEKWAREARETLPTARPVVIRALRTKAEVAAFHQFDPSFTGTRLSAIGCADRVVARIQTELRVWREQRDCAIQEGRTPPRKPCHLAIVSTSTAKLGPAWTPVYLLRVLRETDETGKTQALRDPETGAPYIVPCCPRCFAPLKDATRAKRQERDREKVAKRMGTRRTGVQRVGLDDGGEDDTELAVYLTEAELLGQQGPLAKRACVECGEALWQVIPDGMSWRATPPPLGGSRVVTPLPLPSATAHPPCTTQITERRYPLADYLRKRYRGVFRSVICDEAHQFKGAGTAQGFAAASLVDACDPGGTALFLTGTLFSGYCSDLYPMLWRLLPELRKTFGYGDLKRWVDLYGVRQKVVKVREGQREDGTRSKRREDKPLVKELPGISPLVLRHLLDSCLFLELADVAPGLPLYTEEAVVVPMGEPLGAVYAAFERETTSALKEMLARYDTSGLAAWFQGLMIQPNLPWRGFTTVSSQGVVLGQAEPLPEEVIYPKERTLLDLVRRERAEGRRTLIYVEHTGAYDLLPRLKGLLEADDVAWREEWRTQASLVLHESATVLDTVQELSVTHTPSPQPRPPSQRVRVALLRSGTVASAQRETWLARTVEEGCDVLLCHSGLVEVGLDLLAFPTIICDEVIFSTTRIRQATRRSYRPGQSQPVRVYQLVYDHAMEARGLALIASKIKSSLMVEGKLPGEGFSSFGGDSGKQGGQGDLLLELARSVLADAAGGARDVAGSLEATFRDLATVEQEQDCYIGTVEPPVVDALDDDALTSEPLECAPARPAERDTLPTPRVTCIQSLPQPLASLTSSPWDEWLKAHGVTAPPRSRQRRQSRPATRRSPQASATNLSAATLWSAQDTPDRVHGGEESGRPTSAPDAPPGPESQPVPPTTRSLWEQQE
ncbi:MAG TPA: hypothetical protein VF739_12000 [Ktedonobacterales bacterium]